MDDVEDEGPRVSRHLSPGHIAKNPLFVHFQWILRCRASARSNLRHSCHHTRKGKHGRPSAASGSVAAPSYSCGLVVMSEDSVAQVQITPVFSTSTLQPI